DLFGANDPSAEPDALFEAPREPEPEDEPQIRRQPVAAGGADAPLAARMRPASLDEVVGQQRLLEPGAPLRRLVEGSGAASVVLYGPPGTGKTTLASLISGATGRRFEALSALSAGGKDVRALIDLARRRLAHGA